MQPIIRLYKIEDFEPIFETNEINYKLNVTADFIVDFNLDLARILISNLIRNAIKHNNEDKIIQIESDSNQLIFSNSGIDKALNEALIFNRFYKQGTNEKSNGLGLSIVETIMKNQHQVKINYRYEAPFHQFILKK